MCGHLGGYATTGDECQTNMDKRLLTRRGGGGGDLLTRHSASTSYMALDVSYALEISLIKGFPIPPPPPTYKALLL